MGKKSKLISVKKLAIRIFKHRIVRDALELILVIAIIYFGVSGVLMLALRTDTPYMPVVSNSMKPSFERGDMLIVQGVGSMDEISIGDVIVFEAPGKRLPIAHRVVVVWSEDGETLVRTKGDANLVSYPYENSIRLDQIKGKVILVIPKIGYPSLWLQRE